MNLVVEGLPINMKMLYEVILMKHAFFYEERPRSVILILRTHLYVQQNRAYE